MNEGIPRREFLSASVLTGLSAVMCGGRGAPGGDPGGEFSTRLYKAVISGIPSPKAAESLKAAGIDGIESRAWNASEAEAAAGRRAAEDAGLRIHSVMRAWTQFNNPKVSDNHVETVRRALKTAGILGADAILLVPCRIKCKAPKPWEFDIEFNEKNGHLLRVVEGDNEMYGTYIQEHNRAVDASREALQKLIPAASEAGVVIAVENVWNNLWVKPEIFAHFINSFNSKWIQAYFDIGNHVKYAPPEQWIQCLGKLIAKCHVKDFQLKPDGHGGKFVNIREGSVNWPSVRRELDKIGYSGWMTLEGSGGLSLAEKSKRLELIVQGK